MVSAVKMLSNWPFSTNLSEHLTGKMHSPIPVGYGGPLGKGDLFTRTLGAAEAVVCLLGKL